MHVCPGKGCETDVPSDQLACKAHWFQLPQELRGRIWTAWRRRRSDPGAHRAAVAEALVFWGSK
jgi:hypothetical protein